MIAAVVVRQPYSLTGQFYPRAVGLLQSGSHLSKEIINLYSTYLKRLPHMHQEYHGLYYQQ